MARVPLLDRETSPDDEMGDLFDGVTEMGLDRFMNQFGAMAHHPPIAKAFFQLFRTFHAESVMPSKYLEMSILLVSSLNRCEYCIVHHTPTGAKYGITQEQLQAIEAGTWKSNVSFDEVELAVLQFAEQMNTRKGRIDESVYETLRKTFSEAQMVELTVRTGMCEFFNRFNEAMQLDIEPIAAELFDRLEAE